MVQLLVIAASYSRDFITEFIELLPMYDIVRLKGIIAALFLQLGDSEVEQ